MTIIKQKSVISERHAMNVRAYLNDKDAVLRDTWNLNSKKNWFAEMERTRHDFKHDRPGKNGGKSALLWHQILAFLPEECSVNGGQMTPELCMEYAKEWVCTRYPNQQVAFALHEESDKNGKRYAVHMAINRSNLVTGTRLTEGRGRKAAHARAEAVRKMDEEWGLQQVEEGKHNSKIRPRMKSNERPTDVERIMTERDPESSYKNNLRNLIDIAIREVPQVMNFETLEDTLKDWGVMLSLSHQRIYATDVDILESGNPKHTFRLDRMDERYTISNIRQALAEKRGVLQKAGTGNPPRQLAQENEIGQEPVQTASEQELTTKEMFFLRLDMAWDAYRNHLDMLQGRPIDELPKFKVPQIPEELKRDSEVLNAASEKLVRGRSLREHYGYSKPSGVATQNTKGRKPAKQEQEQHQRQAQQQQNRNQQQQRNQKHQR